ncbi:MAG: hypothetical protein Q4A47_00785 [Erysipelotrichaceae bacterium]|nr:hypothetical protein [Erysipelotrichaceae bacterium]
MLSSAKKLYSYNRGSHPLIMWLMNAVVFSIGFGILLVIGHISTLIENKWLRLLVHFCGYFVIDKVFSIIRNIRFWHHLSIVYRLYEGVDPLSFYQRIQKGNGIFLSNQTKHLYQLCFIMYRYSLGNFNEALQQLKVMDSNVLQYDVLKIMYYHYYGLVSFELKDYDGIAQCQQQMEKLILYKKNFALREKVAEELRALKTLSATEKETYFDRVKGDHRFDELRYTYYRFLHALSSDQRKKAYDCCALLEKENEALFMVQRAKEFLSKR